MDFFTPDEANRLIRSVYNSTQRHSLGWQKIGNFDYGASLGDFRLILYTKDDDGYAPYCLGVSKDGQVLDRLKQTDSEIDNQSTALLERLYLMVKRQAMGGDKVVEDLFAELDDQEGT